QTAASTGPPASPVHRHEISADGTLATVDRHTIVYREGTEPRARTADGGRSGAELAAAAPRSDTPVSEGWDWVRTVRPDEVMLFRYSALTFNSHRIHYDHPYATEVEGYPGLIVHGPLTATFLLDAFLRIHPSTEVTGYAFTVKSPVFVNEQIHLVGRKAEEGRYELEAVGPGGVTVMTAGVTARE
ncbi:MaoC/PaaZ C-terminal domain-containing protein, partial [Nocardia sp. NPDC059091]|uniref:MaoC/PaaZ C-terminal domain-containing protein n=1 Tax=Nocardia sp. NPDC059091 TaxID=3346724 RepID=UPI0036B9E1FE